MIIFTKVRETIGLLRKLNSILPRAASVTIFKDIVRPYLNYGDVLYDQAFNSDFHGKLEAIQYNTCLAITGTIRGTSREKLHIKESTPSIPLQFDFRKKFNI